MHDSIQTPKQMIEALVQELPDTILGHAELSKEDAVRQILASAPEELRADFTAYGLPECSLTPRDQARTILMSMAMYVTHQWNGQEAIQDLVRLAQGMIASGDLSTERLMAAYTFSIAAKVHQGCIAPLVSVVQPIDRPYRSFQGDTQHGVAFHRRFRKTDADGDSVRLTLTTERSLIPLCDHQLTIMASLEELENQKNQKAFHGLNVAAELIASLHREAAIELNHLILRLLLEAAPVAAAPDTAEMALFRGCYGVPTARFLGPAAAKSLLGDIPRTCSEPFPGLVRVSDMSVETFVVPGWEQENAGTVLLVRAKPWELEAPLAYLSWRWIAGLEEVRLGEDGEPAMRQAVCHLGAFQVVEPRLLVRIDLK